MEGKHEGILLENKLFLCLNTGEINPHTGKPDSGCGKYFNNSKNSECRIHEGNIQMLKLRIYKKWKMELL